MQVDFFPPRPSRPLPSSARRAPVGGAAGAVVFVLPWDGTHGPAHDATRTAPRLSAPVIAPEIVTRPRPDATGGASWVHQALTPLPTEGFLALRAATSAYRKSP